MEIVERLKRTRSEAANDSRYKKTWFELHPVELRYANYYWAGASLILCICTIVMYFVTKNSLFLWTFLPLSLGGGLIAVTTRRVYNILFEWKDQMLSFVDGMGEAKVEAKVLFKRQFEKGTNFGLPMICGIGFSMLAFGVWGTAGAFSGLDPWSSLVGIYILLFNSLLCGIVFCLLVHLAWLIFRIGDYDLRVKPHAYGVLSVGPTLVKIYGYASFVWFVVAMSGIAIFIKNPLPMVLLAVPTFIFLFLSFVIIQFPIHKKMKDYKRKKLDQVDKILERLIPYDEKKCTPERLEKINFYKDHARSINELPEWPYSWKNTARVFATTLGALLPSVITVFPYSRFGFIFG